MTTVIDLLLWRHAEAEAGFDDDLARPLTPEGHTQAKRVAHWLQRHAPKNLALLASPARRAQETLQHFAAHFTTEPAIAPGSPVSRVLDVLGWPAPQRSLLLVGHQPGIGQTAAYLLTESPLPWAFPRASLWWFRVRPFHPRPVQLRAVIHPDLAE
ncbi:SixA phosphatase family protein [Hydrogenophilus thermoluteolus]|uniref:Phosphohistidine phosphatase, SixA n=1 Tax=Hydrogenophilus thermoluteolus TaxID=297 RepID=A0A2Z6DXB2_HYDTE|nr:histidine phosphatase family protein [Hydrogenophilus thermoluteolus]BBD77111.1 phosphohistidine phosphatase, SixA [Hydrogenophilus thermoluteolus]